MENPVNDSYIDNDSKLEDIYDELSISETPNVNKDILGFNIKKTAILWEVYPVNLNGQRIPNGVCLVIKKASSKKEVISLWQLFFKVCVKD
jgi:hypothetical protein